MTNEPYSKRLNAEKASLPRCLTLPGPVVRINLLPILGETMPYFLCDGDERHINEFEKDPYKYKDPPLSEYGCGCDTCDGSLQAERYINPPKSGKLYTPVRKALASNMLVFSTAINPIINTIPIINSSNNNSGSATAAVENINFVAIRPESVTQDRITKYYTQKGMKFLSRNGQFAAYSACQWPPKLATESVEEPGFVGGRHLKYNGDLIGRLEVGAGKAPFGHILPNIVKGKTTYPDIVVEISGVVYAIELKTPRINTKDYMTQFYNFQKIYTEDGVSISRSIQDELEQRRLNLPGNYESAILLDLFNTGESLDAAVEAVRNSIGFNNDRKVWWQKAVNGFIFCYKDSGAETVSRRFTIDEILDKATNLKSKLQQANIKSFFGSGGNKEDK